MSMTLAKSQRDAALGSVCQTLSETLKHCWVAYITWRIEQAALAHLSSMSDRELKDIGLTRCDLSGRGFLAGRSRMHPATHPARPNAA